MTGQLAGSIHVASDPMGAATECASWIVERSATTRSRPDTFAIALPGGSTPKTLYELLASPPHRDAIEWPAWRVFFIDERAVPPDNPESNYHLAWESLLSHVPVDPARVHRMRAEAPDCLAAAAEYAQLMAETLPPGPGGAPRLDCVLLGLGENGHIASLFPETPALEVTDAWVTCGVADYEPRGRMTLTFPTIIAAAAVAFLVAGASKREALRATVEGTVPASRVLPVDGTLDWFLDDAAAAGLR
jgi:6-phosphogluconolactonase